MTPYACYYYNENHQAALVKSSFSASSCFSTHTSVHAERLHKASEILLIPCRLSTRAFARIVTPLSGKNKGSGLKTCALRISFVALWILSLPLGIVSGALAFPLRLIDHSYRPAISYIDNSNAGNKKLPKDLELTKENPLHVRTYNIGLVPDTFSVINDLRSPLERAKEIEENLLTDAHKPDVIFFQEAFHEDATKQLCEGIKQEYPYIIHSVLPQISGFNSGALIASKYPLENVSFKRFPHMLGPEALSPRGIIKITLLSSDAAPAFLYGIHMQAHIGKSQSKARLKQLNIIKQMMEEDKKAVPNAKQVLLGDFNTSYQTEIGDDNYLNTSEKPVLDSLEQHFEDPFTKDHDQKTGKRTSGTPMFLQSDNNILGESLPEPSGSWFHNPYTGRGGLLNWIFSTISKPNTDPQQSSWGTKEWRKRQTANTARFDYILFLKGQNALEAQAEIRRGLVSKEAQSGSSDHLPVDAKIWTK